MAKINEEIRNKVLTAKSQIEAAFIEREQEAEILLLAMLSGEHVCLLGIAGTGKSELLRQLATILGMQGEDYFEHAFNKFTTPEEFLGPFSYKQIQNDLYVRNTSHRLPRAKLVFADEVWKCGAALNTLLPVMCEGVFSNGGSPQPVPLRLLVAASNEMPEDDSLGALWDRFLFRHDVKPIQSDANRRTLFTRAAQSTSRRGGAIGADITARITEAELDEVLADVQKVELNEDVADSLCAFRKYLEAHGMEYGDRRWVKAVRALQAKAYLSGDSVIDEEHFTALTSVMWKERDHLPKIAEACNAAINPLVAQAREYHTAARAEALRLIATGRSDEMFRAPTLMKSAGEKIRVRRDNATGKARARIDAVLTQMAAEFEDMKAEIKRRHAEQFSKESL